MTARGPVFRRPIVRIMGGGCIRRARWAIVVGIAHRPQHIQGEGYGPISMTWRPAGAWRGRWRRKEGRRIEQAGERSEFPRGNR